MRKCSNCRLPETYETIEFNAQGVCNICTQHEFKDEKIDWEARHKMLLDLINQYRGKYDYDCIIPFSGGKDSTFTLYHLVTEFDLKPLVVQFNHGFMRPTVLENNERTFKKLGVDSISFTPNWKIVKRLMRESLQRKGDFCWHCHTGIFAYPMQIAVKFNIPLVFWGEPSSEYTAYFDYREDQIEEVDEKRFNRFINLGISAEDMEGMISGDTDLDPRDLLPYSYPELRTLKKLGYRSVCLGSFIPWNTKEQSALIMRELNWKGDQVEGMPPGLYEYEKIECSMQGVRDYLKYLKRGYSRVSQMTALDIRHGRMGKQEAEALVNEFEGHRPPSLDVFLDYVGLTETEFNDIAKHLAIPPFKADFDNIPNGVKTHDFENWYREE